jgi:hypothetical protein
MLNQRSKKDTLGIRAGNGIPVSFCTGVIRYSEFNDVPA